MALQVPTTAEFKTRFPQFAAVGDALVAEFIAEASRSVDESWFVDDQKRAIQYLAAHIAQLDEDGFFGTGGVITSESFGPISTAYAHAAADMSGYNATSYGRKYAEILENNKSGPLVV